MSKSLVLASNSRIAKLASSSKRQKQNGDPFKVGVIDLQASTWIWKQPTNGDFKSTAVDVKEDLVDFNAKGVDALILDLRKDNWRQLDQGLSN
ncbi:MAG: hypothetical protein U0894_07105 [Pirellulales bacterium]